MTPDRWRDINELFHAALAIDSTKRDVYLAEACKGDVELRLEVENLIASHESAEASMHTASLRETVQQVLQEDDTLPVGQDFGPYRVIREIGKGGMGRVFLAERVDEQFHRQVAIKLIKRGMDTDSVIRHFRNEREILASLDHPNIARLFDAGTSRDGLPYFVMEYIEGQPIDSFCEDRRYSITERLQLFRQVCAAVAHAHQHLVIHRDIKPSNILVTAEGYPKLLDFGIARLLGTPSDATATMTGFQLMTPEYASPEQALGQPPSTLTDVYSLGVVLYRLLTGTSPYGIRNRSSQQIAEAICREEPKKPSIAAIELAQSIGPSGDQRVSFPGSKERAQKRLQGDIDTIVLMALRKEPHRRYQSVEQFSEDIRRHLGSLPVSAQDDSIGYRVAKFAHRHRTGMAAGLMIALMMIAGVIATSFEAHRARVQEQLAKDAQTKAERRFNEVRKLAHTVLFDYHDAIKNLPGATPIRERLVRDSLQYLDGLAADAVGDRSLSRELASAYERVADVQGGTMEANLGNTAGAIESGKKALNIRSSLLASDPQNSGLQRELASSYFKVGTLLWETGDMSGAADYLRHALDLREQLAKADSLDPGRQYELSTAYDRLGMLVLEEGDTTGALTDCQRSLEILNSLSEAEQKRESARRSISVEYEHIGSALLELADLTGALENNSRALALRAALAKDYPLNADYKRILQVSYYNQGEILARMGRLRPALASYRADVALGEKLLGTDPTNEQYRGDLAYGLIRIGDMLFKLTRYAEALGNYKASQELRSADVKADPTNLWKRSSLIEARAKICRTLAAAHQATEAREPCAGALTLMQRTALDSGNSAIRSFFADTYSDLAQAEAALAVGASKGADERRRHWQSARSLYERSLQIWQDLQTRNILARADQSKKDTVLREIAVCDTHLQ